MKSTPLALFCYPWDVIDEGGDKIIEAVNRAGLNTIYITVNYHSGMFFLPHNPNKKIYFPLPGALYINPGSWHDKHYFNSPVSDLCNDWTLFWQSFSKKCKENNIQLCAWMLGLHNSGIGSKYSELAVYNAWNDPITHTLCPFNNEVIDHFIQLAKDISELEVFDKVLIESLEYLPLRHGHHHEVIGVNFSDDIDFLLSLNFSKKCMEILKKNSIEGEKIKIWVKNIISRYFDNSNAHSILDWNEFEKILDGNFYEYLRIRENSITKINTLVIQEFRNNKNIKVGLLDFGPLYALGPHKRTWQNGVNLDSILPLVDEIHPTFYFTDIEITKSKFKIYKNIIAGDKKIIPAIRAIIPQTINEENLTEQLEIFSSHTNGFSFYNYSFMNLENLDWIKKAISSNLNLP